MVFHFPRVQQSCFLLECRERCLLCTSQQNMTSETNSCAHHCARGTSDFDEVEFQTRRDQHNKVLSIWPVPSIIQSRTETSLSSQTQRQKRRTKLLVDWSSLSAGAHRCSLAFLLSATLLPTLPCTFCRYVSSSPLLCQL